MMQWKFALRNLLRNKRRSLSTGLAICVGFVGLNLLGAYIYRTKKVVDLISIYSAQRGHFLIFKKDGFEKFDIKPKKYLINHDEQTQILNVLTGFKNDIEFIGHQLHTSGLISNLDRSHPAIILGVDPEAFYRSFTNADMLALASDWILPSQRENPQMFIQNPELISLTPIIEDILKIKKPLQAGDNVQVAGRTIDGDLNAVNVDLGAQHTTGLQFLEDTIVMMPIQKVQELFGSDGIESFSIFLKPEVSLKKFSNSLKQSLSQLSFATDVHRFDSSLVNPFHQGTMGFLYVMGGFFVFLIGTAVSLTLINSLTMGIIERTREIGTLRSIGFQKNDVIGLFVKENIILSVLSMLVGIIVSYVIALIINAAHIMFFPPGANQKIQFVLMWNIAISGSVFLFLFFVAVLSSWLVSKTKLNSKLISLLNDSGGDSNAEE